MEYQVVFYERLQDLKDAAEAYGGSLTREQVRDILSDMPLTDEHYELIYEYLAEQNIPVLELEEKSHPKQEDDVPPQEERRSLTMYMDEISAFADIDEEEETRQFDLARMGDRQARERLIELYLPVICSMAEEYGEESLPAEDLIQEGNLGLLAAVDTIETYENTAACRAHVFNMIRDAMDAAMERGEDTQKKDDGLVKRINHLNDAIHSLEKDLGRKVSAEEVSAYLEMPLAEIEDLMRVAGDQINTQ